jgi:hypothetical protein
MSKVSATHNLIGLLDQGKSVIYGFVSSGVLLILNGGPVRLENTLIVVLAFAVWAMAESLLRKFIARTPLLAHNIRWKTVILEILVFITATWVFVIVQMFIIYVRSSVASADLGTAEAILSIFVGVLSAVGLVYTLKVLTS